MKYDKRTHSALNIAITKACHEELRYLAEQMGLSQRGVIEVIVREAAERAREKAKARGARDERR